MLTMISVAALFAACTNNEIQETLAHTGRGYVLEYSDSNDIQNQLTIRRKPLHLPSIIYL